MRTDAERVQATLDALVEEAYRIALERGLAITNPEGWKAWKRGVYVETARREGPGYLRSQYQRLGLGSPRRPSITCAACSADVIGHPVYRDADRTPYCSFACAEIPTMTLREWIEKNPDRASSLARLVRTSRPEEESA